ncbi:phosphohydrolase [Lachnoanaerobaculum sp. Marseille-Q4761]|uniref:phosphohydrolase n=1 Tax=Lachnoanaerobaculum sp. Marseille-Q4761 TaxID=2819511 RepID=UPI001AA0F5B1|nr:phosphohydrolase [Lachnoanaerobaculum sp. Marseille-Q4761]MBO1871675.1 phosphohydrolase [Lachnoanaerobaculum sp. Marseille-Q4761]
MEIGKAHIVRKSIFNFKVGQILTLIRYGYQAYFGEYNFVFTDMDNKNIYVVLSDSEDDDMKIYHHLEEYFEKLDSK